MIEKAHGGLGIVNSYSRIVSIRQGDHLPALIPRYYPGAASVQQDAITRAIVDDNFWLKPSASLTPGSLLFLGSEPGMTPVSDLAWLKQINDLRTRAMPGDRAVLDALLPSMLGTIGHNGVAAAGLGLGTVKRTLKSNKDSIRQLAELYERYKANKLTKGQYDYRRRKAVESLGRRLGPVGRLAFGNRTPREVLRIARGSSMPTWRLWQQVHKLDKLTRYASRGNLVLAAIDLGLTCKHISQTDSRQKQNEILVDEFGALTLGTIYGFTISVILAATPIGWVAAVAIAAGGVAASMIGSKVAAFSYNSQFPNVDIVDASGLVKICAR